MFMNITNTKKIGIIKLLLWCSYAKNVMLIETDLSNSSKLNKHSHTKNEQSLIIKVRYLINWMVSLHPQVSLYKYTN